MPEEWKSKAEKEKERISNCLQTRFVSENEGSKGYLKQQRKIVVEGSRWSVP